MPDEPIPLEYCTAPGSIKLTERALQSARQFQTAIPSGWTVAFSWHDDERTRASKDAPWIEKGPGMHLGAYKDYQIPGEALYCSGTLQFAVCIREDILKDHPEKTIDLDERGNPTLL